MIFRKVLLASRAYQSQKYEQALKDAYRKMDEMIFSPEGNLEMNKIKSGGDPFCSEDEN